jgi:hypothetical protein
MRRVASVLALGTLLLVAVSPVAASGKPTHSCPPGFNLGAVDVEAYLALPRTQAWIDDGYGTADDIRATFAFFDANVDGVVCVQQTKGWTNGPYATYYYNVTDDHASVPR